MNSATKIILGVVISISAIAGRVMYVTDHTVHIPVNCTVVGHGSGGDRYGDIHYGTVLKCEDGYTREVTGLHYYGLPTGASTVYDKTELKK